MKTQTCTAEEAMRKLIEGNQKYTAAEAASFAVTEDALAHAAQHGQSPYAVVITCSDSRVIPEAIFSAGIGELFVIRVAGTVIGAHQLGSIEYAAAHLGTRLVVVLGHDHCGAVHAAIHEQPEGHIKRITDEIAAAIGSETDELNACRLNVLHSCEMIERSLQLHSENAALELRIVGAVYRLESGKVEFITPQD